MRIILGVNADSAAISADLVQPCTDLGRGKGEGEGGKERGERKRVRVRERDIYHGALDRDTNRCTS